MRENDSTPISNESTGDEYAEWCNEDDVEDLPATIQSANFDESRNIPLVDIRSILISNLLSKEYGQNLLS